MGKRISNLRESFRSKYNSENIKEINEQYINALNQFSIDIDKAFKTAFNKMVETVEKNRETGKRRNGA